MKYLFITSVFIVACMFHWLSIGHAHPIDIHLPIPYEYLFERDYENDKANREAEKVLEDPNSTTEELDKALDKLYGPNGTHA